MNEDYIEFALKNSVEQLVRINIQTEIEEMVQQFERRLLDRKDNYIAEVMKGIRIIHEKDIGTNGVNYKIIFENIQRVEVEK